ncbi:MAG TPA: hypothetical protein DD426_14535, partial [Clostridiaceae bacterium]|nr:hypothetical protein [Clostridiaceae bacterium]
WALAIPIVIFVQWMARAILDQLLHWGWGVVPNGFISTLADFTIVIYISVILFAYIVPTHKLMASIIFSITIGVWYVMAFTSNVIYRTYIVQSLAATIICYLSAIVSLVYSCIHINKYYKKA